MERVYCKVRRYAILNMIFRISLTEKETTEQRCKGSDGNKVVSHVDVWGKSIPLEQRKLKCKDDLQYSQGTAGDQCGWN